MLQDESVLGLIPAACQLQGCDSALTNEDHKPCVCFLFFLVLLPAFTAMLKSHES